MSRHRRPRGRTVCLLPSLLLATVSLAGNRFAEIDRLTLGALSWMSLDGDRVVLGEERRVQLARVGAGAVAGPEILLESPVRSAVLAGDFLYLARPDGIELRRFGAIDAAGRHVPLDPEPRGAVLLGRMTDYLLVVEEGWGLRLLEIAAHPKHGAEHAHHGPGDLLAVGELPLPGSFVAVAATGEVIYLADGAGRVLRIDATDPSRPRLDRELAVPGEVRALAAAGPLLYVLGPETLRVFDLSSDDETSVVGETPVRGGRALEVAGRMAYVAGDEGFAALRDSRSTRATINVSVMNNFFSPSLVPIAPGDSVNWIKNSTGQHNVESCDGVGDPAGCGGVIATEGEFSSGAPTFATFTYSFTFNSPGTNPYFCFVHEPTGMRGRVDVSGGTTPPGVPDGAAGTPMRVTKNDVQGTSLTVSWDVATCAGLADHHIVFGARSQLPIVLGGIYGVGGGQCDVGTTSPVIWNPSPAPLANDYVWWLMVADDNATVEGAWGKASNGLERTGPGTGGASGVCGVTSKNLTNTCGQ